MRGGIRDTVGGRWAQGTREDGEVTVTGEARTLDQEEIGQPRACLRTGLLRKWWKVCEDYGQGGTQMTTEGPEGGQVGSTEVAGARLTRCWSCLGVDMERLLIVSDLSALGLPPEACP
jgi:hypothetical protein